MSLRITSVHAEGEDSVAVCLERERDGGLHRERLVISAGQYAAIRPECGPCSRELYEELSYGAQVCAALKRALASMAYGMSSERALVRKLQGKGIQRGIAEDAVALLAAEGYLSEEANAVREAELGLAKGWGQKRIFSSLYQKQYARNAIAAAMNHLEDQEVDFAARCAEQMARRFGELPETPAERERMFSAMMRYGYSMSEIREAYTILSERDLD